MKEQQSGPVVLSASASAVIIVAPARAQMIAESSRADIAAALAIHDQDVLKLPGVVGIYNSVLGCEKSPWLKVILAKPAS